jgi:hypothetical protein
MTTVRELWPSATLRRDVGDRRCGKARNILDKSFHPTTRDQSIAGIRSLTTGMIADAALRRSLAGPWIELKARSESLL